MGDRQVQARPIATQQREQYDNVVSYLLSCIGFAVGLGNVWRFPKVCLENGGGAFLIPYIIVFFFEAFPLMLIELIVGQRWRGSAAHSYGRMNKALWGLGISMGIASFYCLLYYSVIVAYGTYYFLNSFQPVLPWSVCPVGSVGCGNETSPALFYFTEVVQQGASDFLEDFKVVWHLYYVTIITWLIVLGCMLKGIKSVGKVVYFTAVYPYVMLTIFLIIGLQKNGASAGLKYLFRPDFSKLYDPTVWLAASEQVFFSASLGSGGLIAMASHMPVRNNVLRDTLVIMTVNSATSIYAAAGIFSIKGFMAQRSYDLCKLTNCGNEMVIDDYIAENNAGTGLVFVAIAEAIMVIGGNGTSTLLSIGFFLMIICLGLDSMFGNTEAYLTIIKDSVVGKKIKESHILIICSIFSGIVAIIFCSNHGKYWIEVVDFYGTAFMLVISGCAEFIYASWVYGINNLCRDFRLTSGIKAPLFLALVWKYISPAMLLVTISTMIISAAMDNKLLTYTTEKGECLRLPWFAIIFAIFLFVSSCIWIILAPVISSFIDLDWGAIDYDEQQLIRDVNPKPSTYSALEKRLLRINEDTDFPEMNSTFAQMECFETS